MARTATKLTRRPAKAAKSAAPATPRRRNGNGRKATESTITTVVSARSGNGTIVEQSNGPTIVVSDWQLSKATLALAKVGAPAAPLVAHLAAIPKPAAKLARGVEGPFTEHSRKSVSDNRAANSRSARKARGDSAAVAGKAAKAAKPRNGGRRGYDAAAKLTTLVKPAASGLAEGSGRMAKLQFAAKCKTVGAFLGNTVTDAAGKEHKCDAGALSGMLKREHVRIG